MKKFYLIILFAFLASFGSYVSAETWTKVTTAPDDWSGDYLIVYEAGSVAFDGSRTTLDAASNTQSVTISDGTITTTGCNFYFTIEATAGTYAIKSASGYYIGRTSAKNNEIKSSKTTKYSNTLSLTGGNISIKSSSVSAYLRYNTAKDQKRFRYFSSGQEAIQLYKKSEEAPADQVATPKFTVADGFSSFEPITASATTTTEGATVHYSYTKNGEPQTLADDTQAPVLSTVGTYVVTAIAKDTGTLKDSDPATATYIITAPAVPTAEPKPGTYSEATIIKFTSPEGTIVRVKRGDEYFTPVKNIFTKELTAVNGEKTTYTFEVWTEYNDNNSDRVFYTYTIDPSYVNDSYILCTDIKYLTPGTKVIFVGSTVEGSACRVMTDFYTAKNYRNADAISDKVGDTLDDIGNAVVFTVAYDGSATDNYKYSFYDSESNYLGSGTAKNTMSNQTAEGGIIPDKAKWSISLDANKNYNATILAKKYYSTYPYLRYNSSNPRFACYDSSFAAGLLRIYFNAKTSGVEKVALTDKKAKVYGANGNIVVEAEAAADVNVYNAAGMLVAAQKVGAGRTNIALAKGFYVVRAGNTVTKVAVR